jgi:eukaryotic-like serine/threonine-protein kinase
VTSSEKEPSVNGSFDLALHLSLVTRHPSLVTMKDRWEQIDNLFHAALERESAERAVFLGEACGDDQTLRKEVESLLASHHQAGSFIESPAADLAADLIAESQTRLPVGRSVGPYKIVTLLGTGGMGEVYLAQDTRLRRRVALKILPASFSQEADRIRRFQQEARAVSALNHPNIVTIFEIGEAEGLRFIATEYVEGETLRHQISRRMPAIPQALNIAIQVAGALAAAHQAGIAHRDIKPENIMLRPDGYVKVVDFGLAKLAERQASVHTSPAQSSHNVSTNPGIVMGTVSYMSPEQARGRRVDVRSDIFSLGIVLYEVLTGRLPFAGETASDIIASILREEPPPLCEHRPDAPAELQNIVSKALLKDCEQRYQNVKELFHDLEDLKRDLDALARLGNLTPSGETTDPVTHRTTSSAEYFITQIKQHKVGAGIAAVLIMLALGAVGLRLYRTAAPREVSPPTAQNNLKFTNLKFTKMTSTGDSIWVISPDGKFAIYTTPEGDGWSMMVRQLATAGTARLAHFPASIREWNGAISPDSNFIYCAMGDAAHPGEDYIERIPMLPGRSQRVIERVNSGVSFSPDGQRVAFVRQLSPDERAIILADSSGGNEQVLARRLDQTVYLGNLAWSPDGSLIAAQVIDSQDNYDLIGVRLDDGTEVSLSRQDWRYIRNIVWLPDGSGIVISARDRISSLEQLWVVSYPDGIAQRLTPELLSFEGVSITSDGSKILTSQGDRPADIWLASKGDANRAVKLTPNTASYGLLDWTPDGRVVYDLNSPSGANIWIMDADGSNRRQLTFGPGYNAYPAVTADGRSIAFMSSRAGAENLWSMDLEGGNEKQLTTGKRDSWPVIVPNSQWVLYKSGQHGYQAIMKVSLEGGPPVQIVEGTFGSLLAASPDGKLIAYDYYDEASKKSLVVIRPLDGGPVEKTLEIDGFYKLHWSADGQSLISNREGHNLWQFPLSGGPGKPITHFPDTPSSEVIMFFAYSRDGKNLVATRGRWTSDVVMINLK